MSTRTRTGHPSCSRCVGSTGWSARGGAPVGGGQCPVVVLLVWSGVGPPRHGRVVRLRAPGVCIVGRDRLSVVPFCRPFAILTVPDLICALRMPRHLFASLLCPGSPSPLLRLPSSATVFGGACAGRVSGRRLWTSVRPYSCSRCVESTRHQSRVLFYWLLLAWCWFVSAKRCGCPSQFQ